MLSTRFLRRILAPSLAAALATVTACGGDDDGPTEPTPSIAVGVAPATIAAVQGETKTATVTLTRTNFTGPVNLTLEGATVGATAASAVVSKFKIADGVILALQGVPEGVTATFAPATLSEGANTSTLTIVVGGGVAAGTHNLRVRAQGEGVSAATAPLTLTVTAAPTPTIAIALNPAALSVQQGASGTSQVTITRAGGFAGAVNLAATGQPEGVTVTIDPASVPAGTGAATITVAVGAAVPAGDYPITITATGEGVANAVATLTLTVTAAPTGNYTLSVTPNPVNVQAGGSATATVNIARTDGFASNVALAVSGAPAGLTVTVDPASAGGNTANLAITAAGDLAPGDYTITVTGTVAGLTDQTATFIVHVTGGGTGTQVSVAYCPDDIPIWLAVQDGSGAWARVAPTGPGNNTFTFNLASGLGGVAAVTQNGEDDFDLSVFYATTAEFTAAAGAGSAQLCGDVGTGTKVVNGSVANVGATELAIVSLGGSTAFVIPAVSANFALQNVDEGALDLIATRLTQEFVANKLIIRRGVNVANGGTLDVLDFGSAEAFDPASATVNITGIGTDEASIGVTFVGTGAGSFLGTPLFFDQPSGDDERTYFGVPTDKQAAGELNALFVSAAPPGDDPDRGRFVYTFFKAVTDRTLALGADLPAPTVTSVGTTPYLRLRAQFTAPAEYNQLVDVIFSQTNRSAEVTMTAAYAGTANYDLVIPDLSDVEGFDDNWGLQAGVDTDWDVSAIGGNFLFGFLGQGPTDGATALFASRSGSIGGAARAARAIPAGPTVAGMRALRAAQGMQQSRQKQQVLR